MRIFILLSILPLSGFAQVKKTVFLESGISVFKPFVKQDQKAGSGDYDFSVPTYVYDYTYTYKTMPGYYLKAGVEINSNTSRRFTVSLPVSLGYKEINSETICEGMATGFPQSFNGIETIRTNKRYLSLMAGPKFNFKLHRFTIYTAITANLDMFLSGQTKRVYNDISSERSAGFNVETLKPEDVSANSGLQLGADYQVSERLKLGLSTETYVAHLNTLMDTKGPYFFNFSGNNSRSALFFCGVKLGYTF